MELTDLGTNRLYRLRDGRGRLVWLKCGARSRDPEGDLLAEGLFHLGVQMARLDIPVPHAVLHDRARDVLVTRDVPGFPAREILDDSRSVENESRSFTLGRTLARLHRSVDVPPVRDMLSRQVEAPLPLIAPLSPKEYAEQSLGSLHLLRVVYADAEWRDKLRLLRQGWRPTAPIHGDFRCDNLVRDESGGFTVLDWEYARLGDPLYDVGMFVADRIERSVAQVVRSNGDQNVSPRDLVQEALAEALGQVRPFWSGYRQVAPIPTRSDLVMIWAMAGAALLHRVFGASMPRQRLGRQEFTMLSLSRTLTVSPHRLASGLAA